MKKTILLNMAIIVMLSLICTSCQKQVDYSADINALKSQIAALQKSTDSLTAVLAGINTNLGILTDTVNSIKSQIALLAAQINALNIELNVTNSNVATISAQLASLNQQFTDFVAELNAIQVQLGIPPWSLSNGLVAWYPFTGNANDSSGYGNNGIVNGATLTTDRFGNVNSAYSFNGNSQFINIVNSNSLNPGEISFNVWIYSTTTSNSAILEKLIQSQALSLSYALLLNKSNTLNAFWGVGQCNLISSSGPQYGSSGKIPLNTWIMITCTISSNGICQQYINGILDVTINSGSPFFCCNNPSSNLRIGEHWDGDPQWFNGKIDDLRIYNRILSPAEIQYLAAH